MKRYSPRREPLLRILVCFFLSGAAGLIYQVAWSKALGLIFGHTAYAIATVLAVFMAGLAAGSAFFGRWVKDRAEAIALYSRIEFLAGFTGALSLAELAGVRSLYFVARTRWRTTPNGGLLDGREVGVASQQNRLEFTWRQVTELSGGHGG